MGSTRRDEAVGRRRRGGLTMAVGGALLAFGRVLEYVVLGPGASIGLFVVFIVVLAVAATVVASSGALLASGRWRWDDRGVVGDSPLGHLAIYACSVCWLLSMAAYVAYTYVFRASAANYDLVTGSTILLALAILSGVVAAVSIARAHVVRGFARWGLFGVLALAIGSAITLAVTDSLLTATVAKVVTAIALTVVGLGYALAQER